MSLVSDWKSIWRWHSTWIAAVAAALPVVLPLAWAQMPADLKAAVPDHWMPIIAVVMFIAFVLGRIRRQP